MSSPYWSGSLGYIFPYCPVDEAIGVHIDPVENSVVAALGNTHGQETQLFQASATVRHCSTSFKVKIQLDHF